MDTKLPNREQFNFTDPRREYKIIDYIRSHQGCTKADITRDLQGIISKKTIDKLVDEMIKEGIIDSKKERENSRNIKLFVKEDNPAVYVPLQLEEIETAFKKLLHKSERYYWRHIAKKLEEESNLYSFFKLQYGVNADIYNGPTFIIRLITDSIMIHSTMIWIDKFRDKDTLNKLLNDAFMKLASLNKHYVKYLNSIRRRDIERAKLKNAILSRALSVLQLMYGSKKVYKAIGMEEEVEQILDLVWKFNDDIQKFLFPEIEHYKWDFKHNIDDWRKLLEICENNPGQTAHNIVWGKKAT
jgi:DNA-binding MarR family transcriptional regulator